MDPGLLALATLPALGLQPSQGLLAHQGLLALALLALALLAGPPLMALAPERRPPLDLLDLLAWPQAGGCCPGQVPTWSAACLPPPRARHQARPWRTLPACPDQPRSGGRVRLGRAARGTASFTTAVSVPLRVCRPARGR